jgi:hypothetical protein
MSDKNIPLDYTNSVVYELQKAFWDERGKGARFRTTTVGKKYFEGKFLPLIKSNDIDEIVNIIQNTLKDENIVGKMTSERDGRLLRVQVEGCVHLEVEESLKALDVEPFTCIPANLIVLAIEDKLDLPVELAEIKLEDGACQLLIVVFEKRHTLD